MTQTQEELIKLAKKIGEKQATEAEKKAFVDELNQAIRNLKEELEIINKDNK